MIAANRARALAQAQGHAVSLTQLPPPIEADSDDEVDTGHMPQCIGELGCYLSLNFINCF